MGCICYKDAPSIQTGGKNVGSHHRLGDVQEQEPKGEQDNNKKNNELKTDGASIGTISQFVKSEVNPRTSAGPTVEMSQNKKPIADTKVSRVIKLQDKIISVDFSGIH